MDGTKLVNDLIQVTGRLIEVMDREIDYLRAMRTRDIEPLQPEKQTLTRAYEELMGRLATDRKLFEAVAPALRQELVAVNERFQKVVKDNERALRAASEANQRLLAAIVEAVTQKEAEMKAYSRSGTVESGPKRRRKGISLSVDQRL